MEQTTALFITDVVKEPRTFEIESQQMQKMQQAQFFELDLLDIEGFGTAYPLLTYGTAPCSSIATAVELGARVETVWVLSGIELTKPHLSMFNDVLFHTFYKTCQSFCIYGEYTGDSYRGMSNYDTSKAIFSNQEDAIAFQELLKILKSSVSLEEKAEKGYALIQDRKAIEPECRYKMVV